MIVVQLRILFGADRFLLFIGHQQVGSAVYKELWGGKWLGDAANQKITVNFHEFSNISRFNI